MHLINMLVWYDSETQQSNYKIPFPWDSVTTQVDHSKLLATVATCRTTLPVIPFLGTVFLSLLDQAFYNSM